MFFGRLGAEIQNVHPIVFLPVFIAIIIVTSSCISAKGSIKILENMNGTGFSMDFKEWSSQNKCEMSLKKGDEVQIEVENKGGEIALSVNGKKGSEPYTGNDLKSIKFTVTISETDEYVFNVAGKKATGTIVVKNLSAVSE